MNQTLEDFAASATSGRVIDIKLRELLGMRSPDKLLREITTRFPPIGIGSITLVDQMVLLCLEELVSPSVILEIGTFQGFTTALLACNSNANRIFSVDLPSAKGSLLDKPDWERILVDGDYNDKHLQDIQNSTGEIYLNALRENQKSRISLVKADSTALDFEAAFGSIQFAFVDGGHDYKVVLSDTQGLLKIVDSGVIVWHDYASNIHSGVTQFLHEYAKNNRIFHVLGSLCAFQVIKSSAALR